MVLVRHIYIYELGCNTNPKVQPTFPSIHRSWPSILTVLLASLIAGTIYVLRRHMVSASLLICTFCSPPCIDTIKAHAVPLLAKSAHHAPPSIQSNPPLNTGTDWIAPEPVRDAHSPAHGQMPPPPPLPNESDTPIGDNTIAADGRKTRRRSRATPSSGATKVAAVAEPKKRGRPPGSKNKPKLAA